MNVINPDSPIGIFDSGVGGLTVAKALHKLLPNEEFIYIGDTAHTPWGDKSVEAIQAYAEKICQFLLDKQCKLILVACHTASAVAVQYIQEILQPSVAVINMVDPVVDYVQSHFSNNIVGLIGTKQTIHSQIYQQKFKALYENVSLKALPTPLLCPLVEENYDFSHPLPKQIVSEYLSRSELKNIQALVLGCTHYPILAPLIRAYYQDSVEVIDPADQVSLYIKNILKEKNLLRSKKPHQNSFYITDYNDFFKQTAVTFFGKDIQLNAIEIE